MKFDCSSVYHFATKFLVFASVVTQKYFLYSVKAPVFRCLLVIIFTNERESLKKVT